jgi:methylmalonyl-CoA mutase N-terminal domain/subunit
MGQYSGYHSAKETNLRLKYLIDQGQTGFSIALDLPTQMGLDSDHPKARGEVGTVGVPIDSLHDLETILDGIPLHQVKQIRTTANSIGPIALAMLIGAIKKKGIDPGAINVLIQNDVLKEYTARGTYIFPPIHGVRFCVDVLEYCANHLSTWNPISVAGYHIREAGATAAQELACTLLNARTYIDEAISRGLNPDNVASLMYTMQSTQIDLLEEIAKIRALRRMWARMIREDYNATSQRASALRIFCFTGGSCLTSQQPLNNIVRITIEALAAVLGGVQTLHTSSYDEGLGLPTEQATKVALRTQQILAYETGVTLTDDPLGGSYYVESLTDAIEKQALDFIAEVEDHGSNLSAIETGFIRSRIDDSAYELQRRIETKERILVGVNEFIDDPTDKIRSDSLNKTAEKEQIARLNRLRRERDNDLVKNSLRDLEKIAKTKENPIPFIIEAVEAYATVGEIIATLSSVWGHHVIQRSFY